MAIELRPGETLVRCGGGKCAVCKLPIEPNTDAVQLSCHSSFVRHVACMPRTDTRYRHVGSSRSRANRSSIIHHRGVNGRGEE